MTAATLERIRAEIADMDGPALAQWAARPALRLLIEVVSDTTQSLAIRMQAARDLLTAGWHKAPTKVDATVDMPERAVIVTPAMLTAAARKLIASTATDAIELPDPAQAAEPVEIPATAGEPVEETE